jgi:hypothetical protein
MTSLRINDDCLQIVMEFLDPWFQIRMQRVSTTWKRLIRQAAAYLHLNKTPWGMSIAVQCRRLMCILHDDVTHLELPNFDDAHLLLASLYGCGRLPSHLWWPGIWSVGVYCAQSGAHCIAVVVRPRFAPPGTMLLEWGWKRPKYHVRYSIIPYATQGAASNLDRTPILATMRDWLPCRGIHPKWADKRIPIGWSLDPTTRMWWSERRWWVAEFGEASPMPR